MKVRIFKPHTHAGTPYVPGPDGLDIDVPADAARWLVRMTTRPRTPSSPRNPAAGRHARPPILPRNQETPP
jgi:hypothetical protein